MLFAGPLAGVLGRRFGSKWPLAIGMAVMALAAGWLAQLHDEPWQILVAMVALGLGVAFSFASMAALVTEAVPATETGVATGMNTVMRTVGGVVGGQIGAALLTASTIPGTAVPTESAFALAFALAGVAAAIGAIAAVFVTPLSPRRRRQRATLALEPE
jgi:MFS family permease